MGLAVLQASLDSVMAMREDAMSDEHYAVGSIPKAFFASGGLARPRMQTGQRVRLGQLSPNLPVSPLPPNVIGWQGLTSTVARVQNALSLSWKDLSPTSR